MDDEDLEAIILSLATRVDAMERSVAQLQRIVSRLCEFHLEEPEKKRPNENPMYS